MKHKKVIPSSMIKKRLLALGIMLLAGSGAFAQDSAFLWTAGSSIMNLYNLDDFYNRTIEDPWPYSQKSQPVPIIFEKKVWISAASHGTYFSMMA